jgi:hypothetical protein
MANQVLRFNVAKDGSEITLDLIIALDKNGLTKEDLENALSDAPWEVSTDDQGRLIMSTVMNAFTDEDVEEEDDGTGDEDDDTF